MNAYELADELLRDNTQLTVKAAYMLRQQADRIAELEKQTKPLSDKEIQNIIALLDGIDKSQCEYDNGWWETSIGAKFGAETLEKIKAILTKV